jgi:uncharacterized ferritin-like protein (DUF455 family)
MVGPALQDRALECLLADDVDAKLVLTAQVAGAWRRGELHHDTVEAPAAIDLPTPGRPPRPPLVSPRDVAHRPLGSAEGRAALVHAVAHIEFNAINLAWDAVYRFRGLPRAYFDDWVGVADDEARHFALLQPRLAHYGLRYGDLPAHNGLWEMAVKTAQDPLARMALVPRVLEARGLDVTPGMINRLRQAGDDDTANVLEIILREEVAHVAAGTRWFRWLCERKQREPEAAFIELARQFAPGAGRGPHNRSARLAAGFTDQEIQALATL